jgi:cysteine-rich repeat protein
MASSIRRFHVVRSTSSSSSALSMLGTLLALGGEACGSDPTCAADQEQKNGVCVARDADTNIPDAGAVDGGRADGGPDAGQADAATADAAMDGGFDGAIAPDAEADGGASDAGAGPSATLTPSALDFATAALGTTSARNARIENTTAGPLTVRVVGLSGPNASSWSYTTTATLSGGRVTLAPGEGFDVRLRFRPTNIGTRNARLDIEACDRGCAAALALTGIGVPLQVQCGPASVDFLGVRVGTCDTRTIRCTNVTDLDGRLDGFAFAPGSNASFTASSMQRFPVALPARAAVTIDARFCPTAEGVQRASLLVDTSNPQPSDRQFVAELSGSGGAPRLDCSPPVLTIAPTPTGQTRQNNSTCENAGTAPLLIADIAFLAGTTPELGLSVTANGVPVTFPFVLAPGQGIEVFASYTPLAAGAPMSSIRVASDDPTRPELLIPVSATAIDVSGCALGFERTDFFVGVVPFGALATRSILVASTGTTPCVVENQGFTMGTSSAFSTQMPTVLVLDPGTSYDVSVQYETRFSFGNDSGQLAVGTTDPARPSVLLELLGTTAANDVIVVPTAPIDFGQVQLGCGAPFRSSMKFGWVDRFNTLGPQPIRIASGAGAGFALPRTQTSTLSLTAGDIVPVTLQPTAVGPARGVVAIDVVDAPMPLYVELRADVVAGPGPSPAPTRTTVTTFAADPGRAVDVLFAVETVGDPVADGVVEARLVDAWTRFFAIASASGADFRVGLTSITATTTDSIIGAVVTPSTPNPTAVMLANLRRVTPSFFGDRAGAIRNAASASGSTLFRPGTRAAVIGVGLIADSSSAHFEALRALEASSGRPARAFSVDPGPDGCDFSGRPLDFDRTSAALAGYGQGARRSICAPSYRAFFQTIARQVFAPQLGVLALDAPVEPGSVRLEIGNVTVPARTGTVTAWSFDGDRRALTLVGALAPAAADVVIRADRFCPSTTCGGPTRESGETCDDGNRVDTDGCPSTCYVARCGDGFVRAAVEACDDGNDLPGDGCGPSCQPEVCGNGILDDDEACDDGAQNSDTLPDRCRTTCVFAGCGDGVRDLGEACDDGNGVNTDGCTNQCQFPRCGDGILAIGPEECDDGNTTAGDGCNATCAIEGPAFTATSFPNSPLPAAAAGALALTFNSLDDDVVAVTLPFTFTFQGQATTSVGVSTNGLISFDPLLVDAFSYANDALPTPGTPDAFVSPWWDDLALFSSFVNPNPQITTAVDGAAPTRVLRVRYDQVATLADGDQPFTFEIRLFETTNVIEFWYGGLTFPVSPLTPPPGSGTAGWESVASARGTMTLACSPLCSIADFPSGLRVQLTPR